MLEDIVINRFLFNIIKKKVSKLFTIENSSSKFTKDRKTFSKWNKILEISLSLIHLTNCTRNPIFIIETTELMFWNICNRNRDRNNNLSFIVCFIFFTNSKPLIMILTFKFTISSLPFAFIQTIKSITVRTSFRFCFTFSFNSLCFTACNEIL